MFKKLYSYLYRQVHSPLALPFLGLLFFIEAIFFIPVDPVLGFYCLSKKKSSFLFALVATVSSVIGGITAYFIGAYFWDTFGNFILTHLIHHNSFEKACTTVTTYKAFAIFIGAFSFIPYKLAAITAGCCGISLSSFILWSTVGRGLRFFLLAGIIYLWGDKINKGIDRYFYELVLLTTIIILLGLWILI